MANTYTSLHYHIVFSTKNRENHIRAEARDRIRRSVCVGMNSCVTT